MIFYMLQSRPRRLAYTQAEAKASGHRWELHEVPTDKEGLLNYINAMLAADAPAEPAPVDDAPEKPAGLNKHGYLGVASTKDSCPMCDRRPIGAQALADMESCDEITEAIERFDEHHLAHIETALSQRRAALTKPATPAPTFRKRSPRA